jgi:hypothetical protein
MPRSKEPRSTAIRIEELHPVRTAWHKLKGVIDMARAAAGLDEPDWRIVLDERMRNVPKPRRDIPRGYEVPDIRTSMAFSEALGSPLEDWLVEQLKYNDR